MSGFTTTHQLGVLHVNIVELQYSSSCLHMLHSSGHNSPLLVQTSYCVLFVSISSIDEASLLLRISPCRVSC